MAYYGKRRSQPFYGKPSESLRCLLIKPRFDLDIAYYFYAITFLAFLAAIIFIHGFVHLSMPNMQRSLFPRLLIKFPECHKDEFLKVSSPVQNIIPFWFLSVLKPH